MNTVTESDLFEVSTKIFKDVTSYVDKLRNNDPYIYWILFEFNICIMQDYLKGHPNVELFSSRFLLSSLLFYYALKEVNDLKPFMPNEDIVAKVLTEQTFCMEVKEEGYLDIFKQEQPFLSSIPNEMTRYINKQANSMVLPMLAIEPRIMKMYAALYYIIKDHNQYDN